MIASRATSRVLMVEPRGFRTNNETITDNIFQHEIGEQDERQIAARAMKEFKALVELLRNNDINVTVFSPSDNCKSPDAVFPGNWFSTHVQLGGLHVIYPMRSPLRRTERSYEIREFLRRRYPTCIDLTPYDDRGEYLEGHGSIVFDRVSRVAYLVTSKRTSERLAERWAKLLGYRIVMFDASDEDGRQIFHTNAIMNMGEEFVILCSEAIAKESLSVVQTSLRESQRNIIEISRQQMMSFCTFCKQLGSQQNRIIVMSTEAYHAFDNDQLEALSEYGEVLHTELSTLEYYGGSSVQSMVVELV